MRKTLIYIVFLLLAAKPVIALNALDIMSALGGTDEVAPKTTPKEPTKEICAHGTMLPAKVCDKGAGFLCVNSPAPGVVEDFVMIKGTADLTNNSFAGMALSVQNEYTNEFKNYKLSTPDSSENCWESQNDFCVDQDGFFSVKAPLGEKMGPYTIVLTASRVNGAPIEQKVRTSRIAPIALSEKDITITQGTGTANITVDLLHSCVACDFFGLSTGAVTATFVNNIKGTDGGSKQITETTNIASGGIFSQCITLGKGTNNISVTVCNSTNCPTVNLPPITSSEGSDGINWLKPLQTVYSADTAPEVELAFTIPSETGRSCDTANVMLAFNRDTPQKLCANATGEYNFNLTPATGINIGTIETSSETYSFSFGWGEIVSPFTSGGKVKPTDELWIKNAGGFFLGKDFLSETIKGLLNNFFKSDNFKYLLLKLPDMMAKKPVDANAEAASTSSEEIANIRNSIPMCKKSGGEEKYHGIRLTKEPLLEFIKIPKVEFGKDTISMVLDSENLKAEIEYYLDENKDGTPDDRAMPMIISFRKIFSPIEIKVDRSGDKPLLLLTGPSTDCEYKSSHACLKRPAILVPKDFIGNATKGGSFVKCDTSKEKDCEGINIRNATTKGLFSVTVLDALNEKLYCDGSATLTYLFREFLKEVPIQIGCPKSPYPKTPFITIKGCGETNGFSKGFVLPIGLDLLNNQFGVDEKGISGVVPVMAGGETFYNELGNDLKKETTGFIKRPFLSSNPNTTALGANSDIGISIGEDLINALLFLMNEQDPKNEKDGLFDWEISDVFLKKMGFDAVEKCDNFKPVTSTDKPATLCNLRPRVGDILGSSLTSNGYFSQKHPIMIKIKGNRFLAPHINFFNVDGRQYFEVQFGDMDIYFYALEVDETVPADKFGNMQIKLDANGDPVIRSMNPSDPDPLKGQITRFKLSASIPIEISELTTDPDDPSKLSLMVRPDADLKRIVFRSVPGGNSTVIPDKSLISAFEEKISYGINIYSDPKNAIRIKLPKEIAFARNNKPDQFSIFGLQKINFGSDGLSYRIEDSQEFLDIMAKITITQSLFMDLQQETYQLP